MIRMKLITSIWMIVAIILVATFLGCDDVVGIKIDEVVLPPLW